MKKTIVSVVGVFLAMGALGCGAADEGRQGTDDESSSLVVRTVAIKEADGTYKRRTYTITQEQAKAEGNARIERQRLHRQGLLAQEAEIQPESCSNGVALWLYASGSPTWNFPNCCVIGGGNDTIYNLCGMSNARALWVGESGGLYGDVGTSCGSSFPEWGPPETYGMIPDPDCDPFTWVQLDF